MYNFYSRYLRHLVLPNIGFAGQNLLNKAKILCVGAGGLGSPALTYLSMLGIGTIHVIDYDNVEISNLNRQFIFTENDIGKNKAKCAKKYINNLNSNINVGIFENILNINNCLDIIKKYDVILDCTDNITAKTLISDNAVKLNIPVIHGAIFGFEGYVTIFNKHYSCYRCIYETISSTECIDYGVFGPIAGIIGIIQATEAAKIILQEESILKRKLFVINIKTFTFNLLDIKKNKYCTVC